MHRPCTGHVSSTIAQCCHRSRDRTARTRCIYATALTRIWGTNVEMKCSKRSVCAREAGRVLMLICSHSSSTKVRDEHNRRGSHRSDRLPSLSGLAHGLNLLSRYLHHARRHQILSSSLLMNQKITLTPILHRHRHPRSPLSHGSPSAGARVCWTRFSAPRYHRIKRVTMRACRTRICPCSQAPISSDLRSVDVTHGFTMFSMYHNPSRSLRTCSLHSCR